MFGGHSHSSSGVIMILVCHVIWQDCMIKGSCNFMSGSPSRNSFCQVNTLPSLMTIGIVVVEIWFFWWLKVKIPHTLASIPHYCFSLKHMACYTNTHKISRPRHNWPVCPMKEVAGHTCLQGQLKEITSKHLAVHPENWTRRKKRRKTRKTIAKLKRNNRISLNKLISYLWNEKKNS